jgi:5'-nucleotidase
MTVCRLGRRHVSQPVVRVASPRGESMFWVGAPGGIRDAGPGTDFFALANRQVAITPLRVDLADGDGLSPVTEWLEDLR